MKFCIFIPLQFLDMRPHITISGQVQCDSRDSCRLSRLCQFLKVMHSGGIIERLVSQNLICSCIPNTIQVSYLQAQRFAMKCLWALLQEWRFEGMTIPKTSSRRCQRKSMFIFCFEIITCLFNYLLQMFSYTKTNNC